MWSITAVPKVCIVIIINGMLIRLIKRDMWVGFGGKRTTTVEIEEAVEERFGAIDITFCGWLSSN